jgi:putative flavoprotein involved in K+ transport
MTTVIIGAGPAGLATAARLRQRGLPFRLIDAGDAVGASWRDRYDSLQLHTVRWLSALPGTPIPKAYGQWVRRDDLVRYLQDYAEEHDLRPELGVRASRVEPEGAGWRVETSAGHLTCDAVVVASGYSHTTGPAGTRSRARSATHRLIVSRRRTPGGGSWSSVPATRPPIWSPISPVSRAR